MAELLRRQRGVIARSQVLACGFSGRQIQYRLTSGAWIPVHEGVYRDPSHERTWAQREWAAALATAPHGVLGYRSAARRWDLFEVDDDVVEIVVPNGNRRALRDVTVHRARNLDACDVAVHDGLPFTRVARTLLDLAATLDRGTLEIAIDRALRRGRTSPGALLRSIERIGIEPRAGGRVLAALVVDRLGEGPTGSDRETMLREALLGAGVERPVRQFVLRDAAGAVIARFDLAWPEVRLAVEFDSWEHHSSPNDWRRDHVRRNEALAAGWTVLAATEDQLDHGLAELVAQIRAIWRSRVS